MVRYAVRDIPEEIVAAHQLPAAQIAGFRNALAHTYDDIIDERVVHRRPNGDRRPDRFGRVAIVVRFHPPQYDLELGDHHLVQGGNVQRRRFS